MKEIQPTIYFNTEEVCEKLNLKPSTLRKYVIIIDQKAKNGKYFYRNERGARMYKQSDLELLEKFLENVNVHKNTLDEAATSLFSVDDYNTDTDDVITTDIEEIEKDNKYITLAMNIFENIMEQQETVKENLEHKDQQIESLHQIVEKLVKAQETASENLQYKDKQIEKLNTIVDKLIESQNTPAENTQITSNQDNSKSKWFNKLWK